MGGERELLQRCVAGDGAGWQEFLRRYRPVIEGLSRAALRAFRRPTSDSEVDEISAGVLETLVADRFRALRTFRGECSLETWLRVLVRTVCARSFRRKAVDLQDVSAAKTRTPEPPLERMISEEAREAVRGALAQLPARERRVVAMVFMDGRSYQEVSTFEGVPMGTVATIVSRTRARMRELLRAKGIGPVS